MSTAVASKWIRVTRHNQCPVCGKPDWCLISQDGEAVICARIDSDKPAGNKGAGWLHHLHSALSISIRQSTPAKESFRATTEILDATYKALISILTLTTYHRENLLYRGLTDSQITMLGYKTLLLDRDPIIGRLTTGGVQLEGVPGFWCSDTKRWRLAGAPGILIPVRNLRRQIVGAQIRRDGVAKNKYVWLSSVNRPNGCSPGAPVHVAIPAPMTTSEVWITEGIIKADITSLRLNSRVLAAPGVGNWLGVIPIVRELRPERVIVAFDMDKISNPAVRLHKDALISYLISRGVRTFEADWDSHFNGIDDLLATGDQ